MTHLFPQRVLSPTDTGLTSEILIIACRQFHLYSSFHRQVMEKVDFHGQVKAKSWPNLRVFHFCSSHQNSHPLKTELFLTREDERRILLSGIFVWFNQKVSDLGPLGV